MSGGCDCGGGAVWGRSDCLGQRTILGRASTSLSADPSVTFWTRRIRLDPAVPTSFQLTLCCFFSGWVMPHSNSAEMQSRGVVAQASWNGEYDCAIIRAGRNMLDWNSCRAVERHPERVSGAWVFRGTRVPVSALFANLEGGATVEEFLEWFPGVSLEQAQEVLQHAARSLTDSAA